MNDARTERGMVLVCGSTGLVDRIPHGQRTPTLRRALVPIVRRPRFLRLKLAALQAE